MNRIISCFAFNAIIFVVFHQFAQAANFEIRQHHQASSRKYQYETVSGDEKFNFYPNNIQMSDYNAFGGRERAFRSLRVNLHRVKIQNAIWSAMELEPSQLIEAIFGRRFKYVEYTNDNLTKYLDYCEKNRRIPNVVNNVDVNGNKIVVAKAADEGLLDGMSYIRKEDLYIYKKNDAGKLVLVHSFELMHSKGATHLLFDDKTFFLLEKTHDRRQNAEHGLQAKRPRPAGFTEERAAKKHRSSNSNHDQSRSYDEKIQEAREVERTNYFTRSTLAVLRDDDQIDLLKENVISARKMGDDELLVQALIKISKALIGKEKKNERLEYAQEALRLAEKGTYKKHLEHFIEANILIAGDNLSTSKDLLLNTEKLAQRIEQKEISHFLQAKINLMLGNAQGQDAVDRYRRAVELSRNIDDGELILIKALIALGHSNVVDRIQCLTEALLVAEVTGNQHYQFQVLYALTRFSNDNQSKIDFGTRALLVAEKRNSVPSQIMVHMALARIIFSGQEFHARKALEKARAINDLELQFEANIIIGNCRFRDQKERYYAAIKIADELKDDHRQALARIRLAGLKEVDRRDQLDMLKKANQILLGMGANADRQLMTNGLTALARCDRENEFQNFTKLLAFDDKYGHLTPRLRSEFLNRLANLHMKNNDFASAELSFRQALDIATDDKNISIAQDGLAELSKRGHARGDQRREMKRYDQKDVKMRDEVVDEIVIEQPRSAERVQEKQALRETLAPLVDDDVVMKEEPTFSEPRSKLPAHLHNIKRKIFADLITAIEVIRGKNNTQVNCVYLAKHVLRYFDTGIAEEANSDPNSRDIYPSEVHREVVSVKTETRRKNIKQINRAGFYVDRYEEFYDRLPSLYEAEYDFDELDDDSTMTVERNRRVIDRVQAGEFILPVANIHAHPRAINEKLKALARENNKGISYGFVTLGKAGSMNDNKCGHMITYFATANWVIFIDPQLINGETGEGNAIFTNIKEHNKFVSGENLDKDTYGHFVFYGPMNNDR